MSSKMTSSSVSLADGIYAIASVRNTSMLDVDGGSTKDGAEVMTWSRNNTSLNSAFYQYWLVTRINGSNDVYQLLCLWTNTYLGLIKGNNEGDDVKIVACEKADTDEKKWLIKRDLQGHYRMQNVSTSAFVDVAAGSKNPAHIRGKRGSWTTPNEDQQWRFHRVSLSGLEIRELVQASPYVEHFYDHSGSDAIFLILPQRTLTKIWKESNLADKKTRGIRDSQTMALQLKPEVVKWAMQAPIRADGYTILCGVALGKTTEGPQALNWTVDDDNYNQILFLDPATGYLKDEPWGCTSVLAFC